MTKMTKRIGAAMLSTALLLGALTGCGSSSSSASTDGDNAASASTENPHITVVLKTLASEYWAYVAKGCEQAGKDLCAEVLPADKAKFVADLRQKGHIVLMVGDGINDSPALSEADAGIAISDGAAIAREIADITIAADSLWELVKLRRIAMALMERIHSNYRFVIGFNGTLIGLGLAGILPPAASAALHNLSTLGVSLRSMSALPEPKQDNDRCI